MIKTVAFIDVVHVIPERPEKSFLIEKAAAPTAAWTKNLFSRVRPSSSSANAVDAAAPGRFPVSADSSLSTGADSTTPFSQGISGAEELSRELQARAKKFQKAAASSIGISKLNPRWAAPFLGSSSSSANSQQEPAPILDQSNSSPAITPSPISPPITPEQALLATGNTSAKNQFFTQTHSHSDSLPVLHHPPMTPPQVDAPQMGQLHGKHQGTATQPLDRALAPHEVEHIVATNGSLSKALLRSCLKPPTSMFFAELSMFVGVNGASPQPSQGGRTPDVPVDVVGVDASNATGSISASAEGPAVRGLMTDRAWHRTEGPPVLSRLAAMNAAKTPSPELPHANGMAMPVPDLSASFLPVTGQDYLSVAMPIPQRTGSPNRSIGNEISRGSTPVNGQLVQSSSPNSLGGAWHVLAGAGSPDTAPATSPDQQAWYAGAGKSAELSGTQIPLKAECACVDCHERIINGISSLYTPTWTQSARNQYLANRAQEKKIREQGMDAEVRLALRGMQEAAAKWLDSRDVHELTDEELAVLNLAEFGGSSETHSDGVSSAAQSHESEAASSAHKPPSVREGSIRRLAVPPILPMRTSSISPRPSMSSLNASGAATPVPPRLNVLEAPSEDGQAVSGTSSPRALSRIDRNRVSSLHSRTGSSEYPPPSPSAAAAASMASLTSPDEDPELRAALATPTLSRRTSFASSTFRTLNRRASLESLRVAQRRSRSGSLSQSVRSHADSNGEVEEEEGDSETEDYGSAEASSVVVIENTTASPLFSALSRHHILASNGVASDTLSESAESSLADKLGLSIGTNKKDLAGPAAAMQSSSLHQALGKGSDSDTYDDDEVSTPIASNFEKRSTNVGPSPASLIPASVMRNLERDRATMSQNGHYYSTASSSASHPEPGAGDHEEILVREWNRRPSDSQYSDASVYASARQSTIGHGTESHATTSSHAHSRPGSAARILDAAISKQLGTTQSTSGHDVSGQPQTLGSKASQSVPCSASVSPSGSPQVHKLTLADRRHQRLNSQSGHSDDASSGMPKGPLTIDLALTASRQKKTPAEPRPVAAAEPERGRSSSRAQDTYPFRPSSTQSHSVYPAQIAQFVRQGGANGKAEVEGIGLAANMAGWSVESLPLPPSVKSHSGSNSASASAEDLLKGTSFTQQASKGSVVNPGLTLHDDQMETLTSPNVAMFQQRDTAAVRKKASFSTSRSGSPSSQFAAAGSSEAGLGKRVKNLFANQRRNSKGIFTGSGGLVSPTSLNSGEDREADGQPMASPITPSANVHKRRAFDKLASAVRRGRNVNGGGVGPELAQSPLSTEPRFEAAGAPSEAERSSEGYFPISKIRSAEPTSRAAGGGAPGLPPSYARPTGQLGGQARVTSDVVVPTLLSTQKEQKESGWKPKFARGISTDAIRDALNAVGPKDAVQGHNGSSSNSSSSNQKEGGGGKKSSFAGAFLATLSQAGGGGMGAMPLPTASTSAAYRSNAQPISRAPGNFRPSGGGAGSRRPGTSDGLSNAIPEGFGHSKRNPRSKSGERFQHRPVQSQGGLL